MRSPLSYVPSLPAAIGIVVGVALGAWHPVAVGVAAIAAAAALIAARRGWWAAVCLFLAVGVASRAIQEPMPLPAQYDGTAVDTRGTVVSCNEGEQSMRLLIRIDSLAGQRTRPLLASITLFGSATPLPIGARVSMITRLKTPVPNHIPGLPDFSSHLRSEGITAVGTASSDGCAVTAQPSPARRWLNDARHTLAVAIAEGPMSRPCAEFMLAALIGYDDYLPSDMRETFRATGISHILALSGLHAGIIVGLALFLTMPLNLLRGGLAMRRLLAVAVVWTYAAIAGMGPSVTRAAVMVTALMIARTVGRGHTAINSLLLAVLMVLTVRPLWLYSAGFQLSVCAVAAIIAFSSLMPRSLDRKPALKTAVMAVGIPVAAMVGTGLVSAWHFGTFPLLFLPSNIIAGVLAGPLICLGAAVTAATLCGWQLTALGAVASWLFAALDWCAKVFAAPGWAVAQVERFPLLTFIPYAAGLAAAWLAIRYRSLRMGAASASALAASAVIFVWLGQPRPQAELYSIPGNSGGGLLIAAADSAWIYPAATAAAFQSPAALHPYLRLRSTQDSFALCPAHLRRGPLRVSGSTVTLGTATVHVLGTERDSCVPATIGGPSLTYLFLCKNYTGDIIADIARLRPDTLLLAPDMHPRRRAAIMRRAQRMPVRDLRRHPLALTVP